MAIVSYILYSVVIGGLLAAGVLVRCFRIDSLVPSVASLFKPWFNAISGIGEEKGDTAFLELQKDKTSIPQSSCSAEWWTDEGLFQLEKRAVFSKSWLFVTHACRFQKRGDYRTFEIAGLSIIVILGKDNRLRSFQNVCRHRAYPVTKKQYGSSIVLGCRYHGWSYDTKGKLIKAPEFENVPGFDKSMNGLWEVKTEVINSLVFVNFDTRENSPDIKCEPSTKLIEAWNTKDMQCAAEWNIEGQFNWKLAAGDFSFDSMWPRNSISFFTSYLPRRLQACPKSEIVERASRICRLPSGDLLTLRLLPKTVQATTINCCMYTKRPIDTRGAPDFQDFRNWFQREIEGLENKQSKILDGHTDFYFSKGVQDELRQLLREHIEAETKIGIEINPAAQKRVLTSEGKADDEFCRGLDNRVNCDSKICSTNAIGILDW